MRVMKKETKKFVIEEATEAVIIDTYVVYAESKEQAVDRHFDGDSRFIEKYVGATKNDSDIEVFDTAKGE